MGRLLAWESHYPLSIDDRVGSFPTVSDGVDDVLASHVNELANAVCNIQSILGGLRQVPIADPLSPTNGQVLAYNSGSGKFEAATPASGFPYTLTSPSNGHILVYSGGQFVNSVPPVVFPFTLTTPSNGQILTYSGSQFVNSSLPTILPLVAPFSPSDGQLLRYSSGDSAWGTYTPPYATVTGSPTNGDTLVYSGGAWVPTAPVGALPIFDCVLAASSVFSGAYVSPVLAGGATLNPTDLDLSNTYSLEILGMFDAPSPHTGTPRAVVSMYDLGAPGSPISPVLRATSTFALATSGVVTRNSVSLSPVASPSSLGQIHQTERIYETRVEVIDSSAGSFTLYGAKIKVGY